MSHQDRHELDSQIREIFALDDAGPHPPAEELAAYARGELPAAESERLQAHLGPCRECTAAVLALGSPAEAGGLPDAEVAAGVEAIVSGVHGRRSPAGRGWTALAAAAAIAILTLSLALWSAWQRIGELEHAVPQVRTARGSASALDLPPQTGVPIVDLYPSSVARGEPEEPRAIPLAPDAPMVVLILTPPSGPPHDAYSLRIADAAGVELWRGPTHPGEAGTFVVVLPRRLAGAGVVELYGGAAGSERLLETYHVRFEH